MNSWKLKMQITKTLRTRDRQEVGETEWEFELTYSRAALH